MAINKHECRALAKASIHFSDNCFTMKAKQEDFFGTFCDY